MKKVSFITIAISFVLCGCASEVKYKEASDQYKVGLELLEKEIPAGKSLLEFTTNTSIAATLMKQVGPDLCKPENKTAIARVQRQLEVSKVEDSVVGIMNVATLGLVKALGDPRDNKTPVSWYSYIDSDKEILLQSSSYYMSQSGNSWASGSCGPLYMKFVPKEGKHYKISFLTMGDSCSAALTQIENPEPVIPKHARWSCTKPVMGVGGGELIGLKELGTP